MSASILLHLSLIFFFFNDTATTEIYTLSLHDALPIYGELRVDRGDNLPRRDDVVEPPAVRVADVHVLDEAEDVTGAAEVLGDRKSTRLNSSHVRISYAVFCLKKKKKYICAHRCNLVDR